MDLVLQQFWPNKNWDFGGYGTVSSQNDHGVKVNKYAIHFNCTLVVACVNKPYQGNMRAPCNSQVNIYQIRTCVAVCPKIKLHVP